MCGIVGYVGSRQALDVVLEELRAGGFALGGEQSGHLVLARHATTGDGLLTALQLLGRIAGSGASLAELAAVVRAAYRPRLVLAGGPEGSERPELMRDRPAVDGKPAAYVCENFACRAPVTETAELAAALA